MAVPRVSADSLALLLGPAQADTPAYRWLTERVELLVSDGRLVPGVRIPSERDLSTTLGLSRTTLVRAFSRLTELGYLESRHGSGRIVRSPATRGPRSREPIPCGRTAAVVDDGALDLASASMPAAPGVFDALRSAVEDLPAYTSGTGYLAAGLPSLREAIAEHYCRQGLETRPENVLVTAGALDAMSLVASHLLRRRDRVVVETPGYPNAFGALRQSGATLVGVPVNRPDVDVRALVETARSTGAAAIAVVADFHNPTGRLLDDEDRAVLRDGARRLGVPLVVDETLRDIHLDADVALPGPVADGRGDVLLLGSAAKTYWGGLRLGWVRGPAERIADLARARLSRNLGEPVLEQIALASLLRNRPGLDDQRRTEILASRDAALTVLREHLPGWTFTVPAGGFSLWCGLPGAASSALTVAAGRRGVALVPGSSFSATGHGMERSVRIPYSLPTDQLTDGLLRVAAAAAEVTGAT